MCVMDMVIEQTQLASKQTNKIYANAILPIAHAVGSRQFHASH